MNPLFFLEGFNFFEAFVLNPLSFWGGLMKNLFSFKPFSFELSFFKPFLFF
ncbi:hypothetical protein HPELS_02050 [Helicobacter pylori ELS37]|uniref:Uncharacterized protein n=1 Tax=Helicobacter pylori ELS37 TaxID=1055527 RepID=A0ABC7ZEV9_HELPX|nr:hypothetical protein HPELS_02050 [Helicobacter pylori ELS37]